MTDLTPRQWKLLKDLLAAPGGIPKLPRGSTASFLYLAGYADWNDTAGGGAYWLEITKEGRDLIAAEPSQ